MSTKTVTEKFENGRLIERTTVEVFDPSQTPLPLFGKYEGMITKPYDGQYLVNNVVF